MADGGPTLILSALLRTKKRMGEEEGAIRILPEDDDEEEEEEEHVQTFSTIQASLVDNEKQRQADDDAHLLTCSLSSSLQEERNIALRSQLAMIRTQRQRLASLRAEKLDQTSAQMLQKSHELQHEQDCALQDFLSITARRRRLERMWHATRQNWNNGLNDCFHIRHQGPFATINGLRLGSEAILPRSSSGPVESHIAASPARSSAATGGAGAGGSTADDAVVNGVGGAASALVATVTRVPWSEINAALGLLALLLSSLEKKPHCGIRYRHEIHCAGSTSKMGYRAAAPSTTSTSNSAAAAAAAANNSAATMYNLYYSDDSSFNSFSFFARRNFNTALHCLVQCVVDAAEVIQQRDPTITMPHVIENNNHTLAPSRWEFTVGGLPVAFGTDGVEWTRAMKYLLINVKTLLVFRPFGLWDPAAESASIT